MKCSRSKPSSAFRRYSGRSRDGLRPLCAECQRVYERAWRLTRREALRTRRSQRAEKERTYRLEYDAIHRGRLLSAEARRRARRRGIPFDLDRHTQEIESRIQGGRCEMTGLPLDLYAKGMQWNSPSLDRIDPTKGYTYANIRIVCFGMNAAMGNWGEAVLRRMLDAWLGWVT